MAHPVTHFEINALDPKKLQQFYGAAFAWKIDANNPMRYGVVDTDAKGHGIGGGVGETQQGKSWITFYIEAPDLDVALARIEQLGGRTVLPPTAVPGVTYALFADPEGNVLGLAKSEEHAAPPKPKRATRKTTAKRRTAKKRTAAKKTVKRSSRPSRTRRRR